MISVTGATGKVGGKVAAMLLENGIPVRVLVRSADKAAPLRNEGAEIVEGTLAETEDIKQAFDRCDGAFLMTPLNWTREDAVEEEKAIGKRYFEALKDSTIKHVVYLSVIAAREGTGIPHFESKAVIEDFIAQAGVDHTFLRPTFFMENLFQQWPLIQQMGMISYPYPPDAPLPMVATEDVAYAAVQSLIRGGRGQEALDMLGPKDYTMAEATQIISDIIGRPLRYQQSTPEQAIEWMTQMGMSKTGAEDMVIMLDRYANMEFAGDRNRVYEEFNFEPTTMETVMSAAAGALRAEAR